MLFDCWEIFPRKLVLRPGASSIVLVRLIETQPGAPPNGGLMIGLSSLTILALRE
jgi:hypothetical protein